MISVLISATRFAALKAEFEVPVAPISLIVPSLAGQLLASA